jgi:Helix-turn-helix.
MAEMYKVFERLLKENNKTPSRVSAETGIPKSALSEWKNGRYQLKADKIMILADYFGVPVTVFFGDEERNAIS